MAIPVIDFSKLNGEERAKVMAQIANGCEEWGFFQLVNHGISEELLERVKKVSSQCYKMEREEGFKNSRLVRKLNDLMENKSGDKLENVDWEDVFTLLDDNEWQTQTPGFKETMVEYRSELKKLAVKVMEVMDENLGLPKGYIKKAFNGGDDEDTAFFGTKSVWHRVLAKTDGNRRSIASFYNPSLKATIAPAPQLVEEVNQEAVQAYPKFVFGDYMSVYADQKFLPKEPRFQAAVRAM
ncbi:hypothetical protein L1049_026164 [Liquidambar formosana]|uniref:Non-haem dioxygenase N-terminal domain-containing protein n=1 Tax=Liquidambar formosana TaxID=63359 RepID=A0AAP0R790_LIQFO